jgi:hypothetical protein
MVAIFHLLESSFTFISMQTFSMATIVISLDFDSTFTTMLFLVMEKCFVPLGFGSIFIVMLFSAFDIRISTSVYKKFRNFWKSSCTLFLDFDMFLLKQEEKPKLQNQIK